MGLDMWLTKKSYIGAEYEHLNIRGQVEIYKKERKLPIQFNRITYIEEHIAYWRKANMIHRWFVDNVQNGVDDCGNYEVTIEQLKLLFEICKRVQMDNTLADELLPTQSGCYFGSTLYDEYYAEDIELTMKQLAEIISEYDEYPEELYEKPTYYYHSSW